MNFIYLETFLIVSEIGNFTEAAKHLFVPQPTISNRMKSLEDNLGQELFVKGIKGKRTGELTVAGEVFLPYANQIIKSMDIVKKKINSPTQKTTLKVGSSIPLSHPLLFNYIREIESMTNFLSIDVGFKDSEFVAMFADKSLDLAFVSDPIIDKDLECHLINSEKIELIISSNHPLVDCIILEDLSKLHEEQVAIYTPFNKHLDRTELSKVDYKRNLKTNSFEVLRKLVIENNWISFMPSRMLNNEIDRGILVNIPIHKKFLVDLIKYFIVYRKNEVNEKLYQSILKKKVLSPDYL